jgi:hypothetical protein
MRPSPITEDAAAPAAAARLPAAPAVRLSLSLLCFVAALFACGAARLACGGRMTGWLLAPAFAAAVAVATWAACPHGIAQAARVGGRAALALGAIVAAALAFGAAFYDVSWDGQVYHQPAVLALADGWNPLWQGPLSEDLRPDNLWINHYPKAAWIAQAILVRATGSLEAAKGLQLLPLVAAALLVFAGLRARGVGPGTTTLATVLIAGNPVALSQSFTFYSDGLSASLITSLLALCWHWRRRPDPWLLVGMAATIAVLINLKFTGLVYAVLLCAGLALAAGSHLAFRRLAAVFGVSIAVSVLVLGFDPYITNILRNGHPFYPLMGRGAVDIINIQLAPEFHALARPTRLLVSLFADANEHNVAPVLDWLPALGRAELRALGYPDLRIGGFGPFFGLSAVAAAALALGRRRLGVVVPARAWALAALLVAVAFCNPALWWARYVPQLWLLPAGLFALAVASPRLERPGLRAAILVGVLVAANTALVAGAATVAEVDATRAVREQLDRLHRASGPLHVRWDGFEAARERLRGSAIAFDEVDALPCAAPERLHASRAAFCPTAPRGGRP